MRRRRSRSRRRSRGGQSKERTKKSGVFSPFFLSSFLSFHPGIEAFGDLPFRLIASKKFFFFSLALVGSFCRRLEEGGDGFGKLKSLQGVCEKDTEDYQWSGNFLASHFFKS
jgi:hypothetical protein